MGLEEEYKEFISTIKKVHGPRNHKIKNSYGIYDGFKYYRKIRPDEHRYVLTESQYFAITRKINDLLANDLILGNSIVFPELFGSLELRKYNTRIGFKNGKIQTNMSIDWDATLKLWYEDKEAFNNKTLIRLETKEKYKIFYNKHKARYINKSYYEFNANRNIQQGLKHNIINGMIDAYNLY